MVPRGYFSSGCQPQSMRWGRFGDLGFSHSPSESADMLPLEAHVGVDDSVLLFFILGCLFFKK